MQVEDLVFYEGRTWQVIRVSNSGRMLDIRCLTTDEIEYRVPISEVTPV